MQPDIDRTTQSIALLNDQARTTLTNCKLIITRGIDLLGAEAVDCILDLVKRFDDFSERNDPFGEHDFGAIQYEGNTVFWKIDYYDLDLMNHSPDPSDLVLSRFSSGLFRAMFAMKEIENGKEIHRRVSA